jgi:hypothetical protein
MKRGTTRTAVHEPAAPKKTRVPPAPREAAREHERLPAGRPLEGGVRSRMEHGFGTSLEHVRIHTDANAASLADREAALAVAFGRDIAFGAGRYQPGSFSGDLLLAHEIAHALQFSEERAPLAEGAAEATATHAGLGATFRMRGGGAPSPAAGLPQGGLALRSCGRSKAQKALDGEIAWTEDIAQDALDQYRGMSESDRQKTFDRYYPTGSFARLLRALPPGAASDKYNDVVQDILRRAQRAGAMQSAAASGLADEAAMAKAQADFMTAQNQAAARAAQPAAAPPPTTAQVAAQQQAQVAQTSIAPSASTLTPAQVASWTTRAGVAVDQMVAYAAKNYPELHLVKADFHVDVVGIENRGARVVAYGDVVGGRNVAVVGRPLVEMVDKNPAYAMSTVVHELKGHPEYGPYGTPGAEYGLTLYDRAAAMMPGYTRPTGAGRTSEIDAFAYQETEIYSALRSFPYHTPLAPADAALPNVDPEAKLRDNIGIVKRQWEPKVAKALLRGLYQRLKLDPRITAAALAAFERSVRAVFSGAEKSTADDILK